MATLGTNGLSVSYTYNDSGIRTSKTVNGTETQYYLNGSTILTQITGDDRLDFFYDENGLLIGFSYNGEKYYYLRDPQNNIVSIFDSAGNLAVSYKYDSWGKLISIEGTEKDTIGVLNPFRYRGYYYDTETGFYYLNSRYYDPVVGRFLNADGYISTNQGISEHNMFAYCGNNPIMRADPSGSFWQILTNMVNSLANVFKNTFELYITTSRQTSAINIPIISSPSPVTLSMGSREMLTTSSSRSSSASPKPISFHVDIREDNLMQSSLKIEIGNRLHTMSIVLGPNKIGFSETTLLGNTKVTSGVTLNAMTCLVEFENSVTVVSNWDNNYSYTNYITAGVDLRYAAALYSISTTPVLSLSTNTLHTTSIAYPAIITNIG